MSSSSTLSSESKFLAELDEEQEEHEKHATS